MTSLLKPAYAIPAKGIPREDELLTPGNGENEETETSQTEQTTTVSEETTTTERTARRSFKSPEIVKDLDLLTGKATLKDFLTQKGVGWAE